MASSRWALRAAATVTALAFALPFSSGTASADPLIQILGDNHVNATIGVSGNVDMIDVAAHAHVSLDTGPGISVMANGGIQVALGLCAHADVGVGASVGAMVGAHVDAVVDVAADASTAVDRAPAVEPAVEPVVQTAVEPVVEAAPAVQPAVEPAVAPAPAETEVVAEDKTSTVHVGGISINVGPHAAAMLDAQADITADVDLSVDASVAADASVSVSSDLVNVDANASVGADASVDLGSGDISASAYIGVGLTIG